jgi:iron complex outermembrane receptor protein
VTPLVLLNGQDVGAMLGPLVQQGALSAQQAAAIAQGVAGIPLAVVSSSDIMSNTADVVASYRNFGEVDYWGWDFALKAFLTDQWTVSASSSWVSTDFFALLGDEEVEDRENRPVDSEILSLNAPDFKGTLALGYRNSRAGFNGEGRLRYTSEFPVNSTDYIGLGCVSGFEVGGVIRDCVASSTLFDLLLGYRIPSTGAEVQLMVQNLFDADYRSFVGVPNIGRFAMVQLRYTF